MALAYEEYKKPSDALQIFCEKIKIDPHTLLSENSLNRTLQYLDKIFTESVSINHNIILLNSIKIPDISFDFDLQIYSKGDLMKTFKITGKNETDSIKIDLLVEGDVLIKILGKNKEFLTYYFHTGFLENNLDLITIKKENFDTNIEKCDKFYLEICENKEKLLPEYSKIIEQKNGFWNTILKICETKRKIRINDKILKNSQPPNNKKILEYAPFVIEDKEENQKNDLIEDDVEVIVDRITKEVLDK